MSKFKTIVLVISIAASTTVIASPVCSKNFGIMECGSGTVPTIDFTGLVEMNGTTVTNSFDVLGDVEMTNVNITNMLLKGMSTL
jgi:hypothetical protein